MAYVFNKTRYQFAAQAALHACTDDIQVQQWFENHFPTTYRWFLLQSEHGQTNRATHFDNILATVAMRGGFVKEDAPQTAK